MSFGYLLFPAVLSVLPVLKAEWDQIYNKDGKIKTLTKSSLKVLYSSYTWRNECLLLKFKTECFCLLYVFGYNTIQLRLKYTHTTFKQMYTSSPPCTVQWSPCIYFLYMYVCSCHIDSFPSTSTAHSLAYIFTVLSHTKDSHRQHPQPYSAQLHTLYLRLFTLYPFPSPAI